MCEGGSGMGVRVLEVGVTGEGNGGNCGGKWGYGGGKWGKREVGRDERSGVNGEGSGGEGGREMGVRGEESGDWVPPCPPPHMWVFKCSKALIPIHFKTNCI